MLHSGLVSVTFRKLSPAEIVALVRQAGLEGIEWGGDVHVPHGDLARAREVRKLTVDAGLSVPSYGSYYRAGLREPAPFEAVLETAVELGAPVIRVWAGKKASDEADPAYRLLVEEDSVRIGALAAKAGVTVAFEYHGNTLTDTRDSALRLLRTCAGSVKSYWQPRGSPADSQADLQSVVPYLSHIHAFYWEGSDRHPLADGAKNWAAYLKTIAAVGGDRYVLIEFVKGDSPDAFLADAAALKSWLGAY
jgi:sugar phosphate isomerase/epimerase